jgi:hypothetical protein
VPDPTKPSLPFESAMGDKAHPTRGSFALLLAIGVIDSATRMGFLTFLPFLLKAKGASVPTVGLALALIFAGGAAGKLVCGLLGARIGMLATVIATESATALGIAMLLPLPLGAALAMLPAIGFALNGGTRLELGVVNDLINQFPKIDVFTSKSRSATRQAGKLQCLTNKSIKPLNIAFDTLQLSANIAVAALSQAQRDAQPRQG